MRDRTEYQGAVAQFGGWPGFPFPWTDLSCGLCDRYAVQDGDTYLKLGYLPIKVSRHEPLAQKFRAVHFRLDAASAVVSAPSSPEGPNKVFRCVQGLVSGHGSCGEGFPRFGVLAGRDDGMGAAVNDGIVAFAIVVGAIGRDAADLLVFWDLTEKSGKRWCISDAAPGDLESADHQCFLINPGMAISPHPPLGATMLAGVPVAFALDFDASAVDEQVQRPSLCPGRGY